MHDFAGWMRLNYARALPQHPGRVRSRLPARGVLLRHGAAGTHRRQRPGPVRRPRSRPRRAAWPSRLPRGASPAPVTGHGRPRWEAPRSALRRGGDPAVHVAGDRRRARPARAWPGPLGVCNPQPWQRKETPWPRRRRSSPMRSSAPTERVSRHADSMVRERGAEGPGAAVGSPGGPGLRPSRHPGRCRGCRLPGRGSDRRRRRPPPAAAAGTAGGPVRPARSRSRSRPQSRHAPHDVDPDRGALDVRPLTVRPA